MTFAPLITMNRPRSIVDRNPIADEMWSGRIADPVSLCSEEMAHKDESSGIVEGAAVEALGIAAGAFFGGPLGALIGGVVSFGVNMERASDLRGDLWFYKKVVHNAVTPDEPSMSP